MFERGHLNEIELHFLSCMANPRMPDPVERPYGARPGPFDTADINRIEVFSLGDEEVLVTLDGLGRVFIRFTRDIEIKPLLFDVVSSAWGVDLHDRLLAVSTNSHKVHLFDLAVPGSESSDDESSVDHLVLEGALDKIPDVSFSSDGNWLAAIDISAALTIWEIGNRRISLQSQQHVLDASAMGWSCHWLNEIAFRTVQEEGVPRQKSSQDVSPNPIRSLRPNLHWWSTVGLEVIQMPGDARELSQQEQDSSLDFLMYGRLPDPGFQKHWQKPEVESFQCFVDHDSEDLLLVTSVDQVFLIHTSHLSVYHAICYYPFGCRFAEFGPFDRINLVKPVPALGVIVMATQRGQACVMDLVKCCAVDEDTGGPLSSYSMNCVFVTSKVKVSDHGELLGLDIVEFGSRAEAILLYRSGHIVTIAINRSRELDVHIADVIL